MGNGFELSKFRTRFLFSDVEFGWDKMWILNWVGTKSLRLIGINPRKCSSLPELIRDFAPESLN